jgi:MerR family transcriptional regulator, light-induced transcriptional regulator
MDLLAPFMEALEREDKARCLELCLSWLRDGKIDVVGLHTSVLGPALNTMSCTLDSGGWCIWREHVRSAIVRTVIENAFPYALAEQEAGGGRIGDACAIVMCPEGERHELGARMVADFFTVAGYEALFVGSDAPRGDLLDGIRRVRPRYVAMSVTNFYNLVAAGKTVSEIRQSLGGGVSVLVGGRAFAGNPTAARAIGADALIEGYADIAALAKEDRTNGNPASTAHRV